MIKKILLFLFVSFFIVSSYAETIAYKLKGDLKSKGSEAIEVNSTPLIDSKEIEKSKEQLITIVKYANNQSNDVVKKNENRKPRPKYKGAPEDIYEKFANSVVYIENRKDNGSGSGFVIIFSPLCFIINPEPEPLSFLFSI